MADPTEGSNGKVTLAILSTKLDAIKEDTAEIRANGKASEARITAIEIEQARNQVQHKYLMWGQGVFTLALTAVRAKFGPMIGLD